jgi:aspartate dehydrogenase
MKKIKIGIIGCGTIGSEIAAACVGKLSDKVELVGICDNDDKKTAALRNSIKSKVPVLEAEGIMKKSGLIVEAASASVSADILKDAIKNKKDVMIMSIGGLIGNEGLLEEAESSGIKVYLPSGAICGLDGLKSASAGRVDAVTLTTRKPAKALEGAPYLKEKGIDLAGIKDETVVFEGTAKDAIKGFPQNVNVCACLSLAGLGADRTRIRIITSPDYTKNVHEVRIEGDFGVITTRTENLPSKNNPKTSRLAILSAIATLQGIVKNIRIGN